MTPNEYRDHLKQEAAEAAQRTLDALIDDGKLSEDEAIDGIVTLLDALLPMQELVPGPMGAILEAGDGVAIRKMVEALSAVIRRQQAKSLRQMQRAARASRREQIRQDIVSRIRHAGRTRPEGQGDG